MSLKTRLDGRSKDNNSFTVRDKEGNEIVKVKLLGKLGAILEISTEDHLHLTKDNGWSSCIKGK